MCNKFPDISYFLSESDASSSAQAHQGRNLAQVLLDVYNEIPEQFVEFRKDYCTEIADFLSFMPSEALAYAWADAGHLMTKLFLHRRDRLNTVPFRQKCNEVFLGSRNLSADAKTTAKTNKKLYCIMVFYQDSCPLSVKYVTATSLKEVLTDSMHGKDAAGIGHILETNGSHLTLMGGGSFEKDLLEHSEAELLEEFSSGVGFEADHDGSYIQIEQIDSIVVNHIGDDMPQSKYNPIK
jgi:hypothetical protein